MIRVLLVALGGSIGSVARYWASGVVQNFFDLEIPLGTLAVNLVGSFLIGVILSSSLERGVPGPEGRVFLAVGFCGGFTTMSTLSYETLALLRGGSIAVGVANVLGTILLCLAAAWLGDAVARLI
ncbi:MAG: fluoride efflux transporter CrcB [Deltaproteobacteria bacterium]|nr:fluoride efflux transporter CrcB [Deltaproteobacteria bacterium]